MQHLHHVFVVVTPAGGGPPCVVDPLLRSSFELCDMTTTAAYAAALPACEHLFLSSSAILRVACLMRGLPCFASKCACGTMSCTAVSQSLRSAPEDKLEQQGADADATHPLQSRNLSAARRAW